MAGERGDSVADLKVTQRRSAIGSRPRQRGTLRALGLGKIGRSNVLPDRPEIRGMIAKVPHLVSVEEVAKADKAPAKKAPADKAPAEKAQAEKAPAKKAQVEKAAKKAPAKKAAKKAPAKKAAAKKSTAKKAT